MKKHMEKYIKYAYPICFALLILLIAFLAFYRLDVKYVDPWDEARHGVNAYEMANGGSLFQNTYLRQADYYNLKPPLSMWCIMLSMALFGNNVFALRFYSAFCYVLLSVLCGLYIKKYYGKTESLFAVAFLAINTTPFQAHMIRAGDADSLFVLLFTMAMLCMMGISKKKYNLYLCGLFFALAFLTKSFHAGVIAAIGGLYLLLTGEIKKLSFRNWAIFIASVVLPILFWALPRSFVDGTDFFVKMWQTDVLGRTDGTLQNNIAPFTYYLEYYLGAASGKITPYLCAAVICLIGCFLFSHIFTWKSREKYLGWLLWIFVPFLAFSLVTNKLLWYMYPVLIPLLLAAGIVSARIIKSQKVALPIRSLFTGVLVYILVFYVLSVTDTIQSQGRNDFQELVKKVAQTEEYKGYEVFVDYSLEDDGSVCSTWSQQDVFVAQAYGDFVCVENGMMGLMLSSVFQNKIGIIFVGNDVYDDCSDFYDKKKLIAESENYRAFLISY